MKHPVRANVVLAGDARDVLFRFPDNLFQCCVTSPPYWRLRNYECSGQFGLEATPEEYVANMVAVFREVRRVLREDGTLWLNLGDSYSDGNMIPHGGERKDRNHDGMSGVKRRQLHLRPKNLVGIPWRVAFALQADGWYLRQAIIWHKTSPMPESVKDRCTRAHEYIFLLTRNKHYYYDAEAIKESCVKGTQQRNKRDVWTVAAKPCSWEFCLHCNSLFEGKERRGIRTHKEKTCPVCGSKNAWVGHFAQYPKELIEPCIKAGISAKGACASCGAPYERIMTKREAKDTGASTGGDPNRQDGGIRERDKTGDGGNTLATKTVATGTWKPTCTCNSQTSPCFVLDPFAGAATTGIVALENGAEFIGIDINSNYCEVANARIRRTVKR